MARIAKLPAVKAKAKREGWLKWIRSEADERAALRGCYFSPWHAERVETFCSTFCCHSKGQWAGSPFELLRWQRDDLVWPLFGWMRADGSRRYRRAYIEVAKKNGKSALVSALGLYLLIADSYPETKSVYKAWSGAAKGKSGFSAHACLCDELQEWQGRKLWENLIHAGRARRQPLLIVITNAGDDMLSVCREQHEYAERVIDGTFEDDRFFGLIYSVTKEELDEHGSRDRRLWRKANPSMGVTINEEDFLADLIEAERTPTAWAEFCRKSFSIWNTGIKRWLQLPQWRACIDAIAA